LKFRRKPLRDDIQKEILGRIVDGTLPAGRRINETHLAEDLGLSRTPLREAMLTLAAAGFLKSDMGRGFAVPPLEAAEMIHVQDLLAMLEPVALGHCLPLPGDRLLELSNSLSRAKVRLEKSAGGAPAGMALAGLVFAWSEGMTATCPNPVLKADINRLEGLAARYWFAAGAAGLDTGDLLGSLGGLYELVRQNRHDRACQVWEDHIRKFGRLAAGLESG
jgi:DNA-binding GntR family transcriptional regulator